MFQYFSVKLTKKTPKININRRNAQIECVVFVGFGDGEMHLERSGGGGYGRTVMKITLKKSIFQKNKIKDCNMKTVVVYYIICKSVKTLKLMFIGGIVMDNSANPTNNEAFDNSGNVNISDEVVSVIASMAAAGVSGVSGMVGGVAGGFVELLGKKNLSKGVKITTDNGKVSLDLAIIVEYGAKIPDVAWDVQEKVKSEVEVMTGLEVIAVNISVEGVNVPSEPKKVKTGEAEKTAETFESDDDIKNNEAAEEAESEE